MKVTRKLTALRPEFLDGFMPEEMAPGVLYISERYGCAIHLCACGCGEKTVTPLSDNGWTLTRDGDAVSLRPSIGNHQMPCKSHYFITRNQVVWA